MQTPTHLPTPTDPKLIAALDRAQIDPRTLEQLARLERARAIGEALAGAIAWLIRLPQRLVDASHGRAADRHA